MVYIPAALYEKGFFWADPNSLTDTLCSALVTKQQQSPRKIDNRTWAHWPPDFLNKQPIPSLTSKVSPSLSRPFVWSGEHTISLCFGCGTRTCHTSLICFANCPIFFFFFYMILAAKTNGRALRIKEGGRDVERERERSDRREKRLFSVLAVTQSSWL